LSIVCWCWAWWAAIAGVVIDVIRHALDPALGARFILMAGTAGAVATLDVVGVVAGHRGAGVAPGGVDVQLQHGDGGVDAGRSCRICATTVRQVAAAEFPVL